MAIIHNLSNEQIDKISQGTILNKSSYHYEYDRSDLSCSWHLSASGTRARHCDHKSRREKP